MGFLKKIQPVWFSRLTSYIIYIYVYMFNQLYNIYICIYVYMFKKCLQEINRFEDGTDKNGERRSMKNEDFKK